MQLYIFWTVETPNTSLLTDFDLHRLMILMMEMMMKLMVRLFLKGQSCRAAISFKIHPLENDEYQ